MKKSSVLVALALLLIICGQVVTNYRIARLEKLLKEQQATIEGMREHAIASQKAVVMSGEGVLELQVLVKNSQRHIVEVVSNLDVLMKAINHYKEVTEHLNKRVALLSKFTEIQDTLNKQLLKDFPGQ
jgi:predicted membrane GTPase involved in stress response